MTRPLRVVHEAKVLAEAKWKGSGLDDHTAEKLSLVALTGEETGALAENFHAVCSLKIPYFDLDGKATDFYRIRYLEDLPGFAGTKEKPQRYAQAAGTLNEIYFPPLFKVTWRELADDTTYSMWITEGELKAAAACKSGIVCMGLGGVDVWKSGAKGFHALPALTEIKWEKRTVRIVFDSDSMTNDKVMGAQLRLARWLRGVGALPVLVALPTDASGRKVGLDDYLIEHTVDDLEKLVDTSTTEFEAAATLWEMHEQAVVLKDPPAIYLLESEKLVNPSTFTQLTYANKYIYERKPDGTLKEKLAAKEYLAWPHRREMDGMIYAPGEPLYTQGRVNKWRGWGTVPRKGDVSLWHKLLDIIFGKNDEARRWFEQWCAYPLQYPGTKMYSAAVIWGHVQGTGKSLLAHTLMRIYGRNAEKITNRELRSPFNNWALGRQFVYMDEITGGDSRVDSDYIKDLITQEHIRINNKFEPVYTLKDCINYIANSNHPDSFFIDDNDRRFFVQEVAGPKASQDFYDKYDKWYRPDDAIGPAAVHHHLLHVHVGNFNPRGPALVTKAKLAMIEANRSTGSEWVARLKSDPDQVMMRNPTYQSGCELFTVEELLSMMRQANEHTKMGGPGMGKELQSQGFRQLNDGTPVHTALGKKRMYAVKRQDHWLGQPTRTLAEHYNRFNKIVKE